MPGCPSRLRPYLEGEGITKKSNPWKTTSLDRSIMGNQHYNGWCSHLGWAASFIKRAKLNYIFRLKISNLTLITSTQGPSLGPQGPYLGTQRPYLLIDQIQGFREQILEFREQT